MTPGVLGGPGVKAPTASNFYSATLAMSWELDIWGRIRRSTEAARANLLASEDARRGVWLTLVSDLAQAYFELLALDVQLQIARTSTAAYQGTYDLFLDRFNHGAASKLETLARARCSRRGAGHHSRSWRAVSSPGKTRSVSCWARSPGPIPRGQPMYAQPVVPAVPAGLPSTLLERRPDLRQAEQQLVGANARIGVAKAEFFPKFNLTPLIGAASPEFSDGRRPDDLGGGRHAHGTAVQRRPHPGELPRLRRPVGAGGAAIPAGGARRAPRGRRTRSPRWASWAKPKRDKTGR